MVSFLARILQGKPKFGALCIEGSASVAVTRQSSAAYQRTTPLLTRFGARVSQQDAVGGVENDCALVGVSTWAAQHLGRTDGSQGLHTRVAE